MNVDFSFTQQLFSDKFFTLNIHQTEKSTTLLMSMLSPYLRTGNLSQTLIILKKDAPAVLQTTCHNNLNLSFEHEVVDTEIGHLFEHLVIDHLSRSFPYAQYHQDSCFYVGLTEWDWHTDTRGTFHITLSVGKKERKRLHAAMRWAYEIIGKILSSERKLTISASAGLSALLPIINTEAVGTVSV